VQRRLDDPRDRFGNERPAWLAGYQVEAVVAGCAGYLSGNGEKPSQYVLGRNTFMVPLLNVVECGFPNAG